jgi:DNA-binding SARP family transcriptional activator
MVGRPVIRVLGPVDVEVDGRVRSIGSRHARAILAVLAMSAGRAVPIEQLREVAWPGGAPRSAEASIHSYVSRLRRLLGVGAVERVEHSYRIGDADIDAVRFEQLLEAAIASRDDPQLCATRCSEALGAWRGPPFGDLGDDEAFRLEALRLDELRLVAMELALEAEVRLGHHEVAAAELETAVREHPYREHLWYLLIEALRLDGRRVEALRACNDLRHVLSEVGLTPAPTLTDLEHQILHP